MSAPCMAELEIVDGNVRGNIIPLVGPACNYLRFAGELARKGLNHTLGFRLENLTDVGVGSVGFIFINDNPMLICIRQFEFNPSRQSDFVSFATLFFFPMPHWWVCKVKGFGTTQADENTGMFMYNNVEYMEKILSELGRRCDKNINTIRYPPAK